jgi:hypothetical protein
MDASSGADAATDASSGADIGVESSSPPDGSGDTANDSSSPSDDAGGDADAGQSNDAAPCAPITLGLIGHYRMGAGSINGSTATDVSGSGNHGSLIGFTQSEPQSAPAPFDEAVVFPSAGQAYVEVPNLPLNTAHGGANSVSLWFYRSGPIGSVNDVLVSLPNFPVYDLWLTFGVNAPGSDIYLCINAGQDDCYGIASTTLLDRWVHVVAVFPNGATTGGTLYVDGQKQVSSCVTGNGFQSCAGLAGAAQAPLDFGRGNNGFYYGGILYDARVYSRALTASEVAALYNGTACP